ncbi:aromatic ring-hydroxylating dioxygenase subunit alpha [Nocardia otitidiscaviarum]|uniref:Aromatic ring-hydroxylating dioxygenase subunit alpha n=1 Tax=Nocardia otitidiscaviarum TaxID=1823 RepID=A0A516NM08_9NOCA|nr:aromatic ring-hydroxylating dioxygenase subunit alpha [Nocardia otitidiscaviarum]MCP9624940.1 aromatic ring-hydroxylating dioxygenase subunit alpha [Nocardia otitidiscaviarum]QDP79927.1 aromatic ring-hydroxylating dioxygenase subunit alpha [Nocardia otitidiscaviarum]
MTDLRDGRELAPGEARSPGPSVQSLLSGDTREVPPPLLEESYEYLGSADIDKERYLSADFHRLEVEKMWKKVWQLACREEDIPAPGDYIVYDIADISLIVVRTRDGEIRAYHNACLHRGTRLCDDNGHAEQLRCPFHGFTWGLDGALAEVPSRWDFPHVEDAKFALPQAKTGVWAGYVFVNPDPDAVSLHTYLGEVEKHFAYFKLEERFKAVHVAKVIDCNWKVALEAFIESYHVISTHPQLLEYLGDSNTQYDVYRGSDGQPGFNRMITPQATTSPHLEPLEPQDVLEAMFRDFYPEGIGAIHVPEGQSARPIVAEALRQRLVERSGADLSGVSDSEIVDAIQYFVFPNMCPWAGLGAPLTYRFRPYGNDPDRCVFEIMLLAPLPAGVPKPKAGPIHWLGPDEDFSAAPELGGLAPVLNQDLSNLPLVQRGLKAMTKPGVTLADYQEVRIRQFHQDLDAYLAK